jgi:predicted TIM-barrel fold metal-dependent hydrolase
VTERLGFVDTHVHLWELKHPAMRYAWLEPGATHPHLTAAEIARLASSDYLIDDFKYETRHAGVIKIVHVQAAVGIADPVRETEWLQAAADRTGFPHAIVGHASLQDAGVQEVLERHLQYPNFRGIRDFGRGDYLVDSAFRRGFGHLRDLGLVFSLDCLWENMDKAVDLARRFPTVPIVLDHMGYPQERTREYFESWRRAIRRLADAGNVNCKISEVGMADKAWTIDSVRPWILECLEVFTPARCMFGTNWPVDKLYSSYDALVDTYRHLVRELSVTEQTAVLSGNAERLYRI